MDFGEYSVKNVKTFKGMEECGGFNADLYRGKKKIAFCIDEDCGGEVLIRWIDKAEIEPLQAHVKSLPRRESEYFPEGCEIDEGDFVWDLVNEVLYQKDVKRMVNKAKKEIQSKWLFLLKDDKEGTYRVINKAPGQSVPLLQEHLDKKYGNGNYTLINTMPEDEAIKMLCKID